MKELPLPDLLKQFSDPSSDYFRIKDLTISPSFHPHLTDLSTLAPLNQLATPDHLLLSSYTTSDISPKSSPSHIRQLLLRHHPFAISPNSSTFGFSQENFNLFMRLVYSQDYNFDAVPPTWGEKFAPTTQALIQEQILLHKPQINVLEIGIGAKSSRWTEVFRNYSPPVPVHITLTDLNLELAQQAVTHLARTVHSPLVSFHAERLDLLNSRLPHSTFDLCLAFYILDSLHPPQDQTLILSYPSTSSPQTYQLLYRTSFSPHHIGTTIAREFATYVRRLSHLPQIDLPANLARALCLETACFPVSPNPDQLLSLLHLSQSPDLIAQKKRSHTPFYLYLPIYTGTRKIISHLTDSLSPQGKLLIGEALTTQPDSLFSLQNLFGRIDNIGYRLFHAPLFSLPNAQFTSQNQLNQDLNSLYHLHLPQFRDTDNESLLIIPSPHH